MSGKEANSKTNNYVGIWCHSMDPIAGDSFKGKNNEGKIFPPPKKEKNTGRGVGKGGGFITQAARF